MKQKIYFLRNTILRKKAVLVIAFFIFSFSLFLFPNHAYSANCSNEWGDSSFNICFWDTSVSPSAFLGEIQGGYPTSSPVNPVITFFAENYEDGYIWFPHKDKVQATYRGEFNFSSGDYKFWVITDDGAVLIIDRTIMAIGDAWKVQHATYYESDPISLSGWTKIRLDWYENTGWAKIEMGWEKVEAPPPCTNHCSPSSKKVCIDNTHYMKCGNYDADSCLEWSSLIACPSGQTCSGGVCSAPAPPPPPPPAPSNGSVAIIGTNSAKVCFRDNSTTETHWFIQHLLPDGTWHEDTSPISHTTVGFHTVISTTKASTGTICPWSESALYPSGTHKYFATAWNENIKKGSSSVYLGEISLEAPPLIVPCNCDPSEGQYKVCYFAGTNANPINCIKETTEAGPKIDHNWGTGAIVDDRVDNLSGTWRGFFNFEQGKYDIECFADDGIIIQVNGNEVYREFAADGSIYAIFCDDAPTLELSGRTQIKVTWNEKGGNAALRVDFVKEEVPICTNLCAPSGEKKCYDDTSYQICGDYNGDGCLEWSDSITCPATQTCLGGVCSATPTPGENLPTAALKSLAPHVLDFEEVCRLQGHCPLPNGQYLLQQYRIYKYWGGCQYAVCSGSCPWWKGLKGSTDGLSDGLAVVWTTCYGCSPADMAAFPEGAGTACGGTTQSWKTTAADTNIFPCFSSLNVPGFNSATTVNDRGCYVNGHELDLFIYTATAPFGNTWRLITY